MLALSEYDHMESLDAFQKGWIQVQDISSALVGELAAPEKGQLYHRCMRSTRRKNACIWQINGGTGCVEARDLTYQKVALIEENCQPYGCIKHKSSPVGCH